MLLKQGSIPVGCVPPACQPYMLQLPDVSTYWGCPQVNKFEQVSSDGHRMLASGTISEVQGRAGGTCAVRSNASWVMVTWGPSPFTKTDRQTQVKTLPSCNLKTPWPWPSKLECWPFASARREGYLLQYSIWKAFHLGGSAVHQSVRGGSFVNFLGLVNYKGDCRQDTQPIPNS